MVDVYVHVGTHKTATTSLHGMLRRHAAHLRRHGILVSEGSRDLDVKRTTEGARARITRDLDTARREGCSRLIYSQEDISTHSAEQFQQLTALFAGHRVTYSVCFRHWASFLPSRWAQNTWRRDCQSFPEYLEALGASDENLQGRFALVVQRIESADPHDMRVVSFDNAVASGEGPVAACLRALDVAEVIDRAVRSRRRGWRFWRQQTPEPRRNQRRPWRTVELVRLLNAVYVHAHGLAPNGLFDAVGRCEPVREFFDLGKGEALTVLEGRDPDLFLEAMDLIDRNAADVVLSDETYDWSAWADDSNELLAVTSPTPSTPVSSQAASPAARRAARGPRSTHVQRDVSWHASRKARRVPVPISG